MKLKMIVVLSVLLVLLPAVAFSHESNSHDRDRFQGAVYTMTNDSSNNQVVVFGRYGGGGLTKMASVSTGGAGSGTILDSLGSQGSLALTQDQQWLLAVNAGSNEISVFDVTSQGLKLASKVDSGGVFPVSIAVFYNIVFVLNSGGSAPNITGFALTHKGALIPLADSTRALGSSSYAQVGFDPWGNSLIVTDKGNSAILVFPVEASGLPAATPVVSASSGQAPFGFIFDRYGHLLVAEAGTDAVSSYSIMGNGTLQVISSSVLNGQQATCWIAGDSWGRVFTTSPGTQAVSYYSDMVSTGQVTLVNATAGMANRPLDLAVSSDEYLYALDPAAGGIHTWKVNRDGSLSDLGLAAGGLGIFAQGIAVRSGDFSDWGH